MKNALWSAAAGSLAEQDYHIKDFAVCVTLNSPYPHKSRELRRFLAFPDSTRRHGGNRDRQCGTFFESKSFQAIYCLVGFAVCVHRFSVQRSGLPFCWVHGIRGYHCPTGGRRDSGLAFSWVHRFPATGGIQRCLYSLNLGRLRRRQRRLNL